MPPGDDEIKDGQWLGVTVRSMGPGKKVMVCILLNLYASGLSLLVFTAVAHLKNHIVEIVSFL